MPPEAPSQHGSMRGWRQALAARAQAVLEASNGEADVVRATCALPGVDVLPWLGRQTIYPQGYWSARDGREEVALLGAADVCVGPPRTVRACLHRRLGRAPGLRYYGGMRFDAQASRGAAWAPFEAAHFLLPRFELRRRGEEAPVLTCTLVLPRDRQRVAEVREAVGRLAPAEAAWKAALPTALRRTDVPTRRVWRERVGRVLAAIRKAHVEKVVLARRATFELDAPMDPVALLAALQSAAPGCYHFMARPSPTTAFVSATPERLLRVAGRRVTSEAVAGTRPRGRSAQADDALRAELLGSEKDRHEHAVVSDRIRADLRPLCSHLTADEGPTALTLERGRHLYARVEGTLRDGVSPLDVLAALHPTPAVGGEPRREALRMIRDCEPFDRGWYAGPVGWVEAGAAEFAVGIRSGLVRDRTLALFSGAGLVEGSVPEKEWREIEQKISDFAAVLNLSPAASSTP